MKDIRRLLAPGGVVHVAVPNIGCWEAWLSGWTSYEPYHLVYFNLKTLKRVIASSGFLVEHDTTQDSFSGWFLAILRTVLGVNRESGAVCRPSSYTVVHAKSYRSGFEHSYRLAMMSAGLVLWPMRWLQGRIGCGDEVICVARKPR